ncbi:MAG: hypothetical protein JW861_01415 [Bacteroidales bacterium]|nr:hypothetical protein [Bacteroidales bacterium]
MEGILIAIITGIFSLTGIWLSHYLKERKDARTIHQPDKPEPVSVPKVIPTKKKAPHIFWQPEKREAEKISFLKKPSWWFLSAGMVALCIGAAFFARWIISYGLGVFNLVHPDVHFGWLVLLIGGIAWGLAYVIVGSMEADDVEECLFAVFIPYEEMFDPDSAGGFLGGLVSAVPFNLLISWGAAVGLGHLAANQLGANLSGVVYLVFGVITVFAIIALVKEAE